MTSSHMFGSVPAGKPSLRAAYEAWLKAQHPRPGIYPSGPRRDAATLNVGIVGGGMAGLYAALLLQQAGAQYHIFEANNRLGGRVYTYRFNPEPNQYFEAGAMRLPEIPEQQPVFDLIDYLNARLPDADKINLIPYQLYDTTGNLVYVNGQKDPDGNIMTNQYANANPDALKFPLPADDKGKTAAEMLDPALSPFLELLEKDFDAGFLALMEYDNYSLYTYLTTVKGWTDDEVNYVEVMTSQTNQFHNSFTEMVIENMDFSQASWKTIDQGMEHLPYGCAQLVGSDNITLGVEVQAVDYTEDGRVSITTPAGTQIFDKVILAVPPAALRMISTPQWSPDKMHAIRALHFEPLYKIGLRFETRFWEKIDPPSQGGQSISDLPSRWCVYPSYGIGDSGPGVLLLYTWMTDAYNWLPQSTDNRVRLALRDLQQFYPNVNVQQQFIEAADVAWPSEWATGDAMFFPGQFRSLFAIARQPEGNIFFAGEHLSVNHTWIVGAIDSALLACQQLLNDPDLKPLSEVERPVHDYDYSRCVRAKPLPAPNSAMERWLAGGKR